MSIPIKKPISTPEEYRQSILRELYEKKKQALELLDKQIEETTLVKIYPERYDLFHESNSGYERDYTEHILKICGVEVSRNDDKSPIALPLFELPKDVITKIARESHKYDLKHLYQFLTNQNSEDLKLAVSYFTRFGEDL